MTAPLSNWIDFASVPASGAVHLPCGFTTGFLVCAWLFVVFGVVAVAAKWIAREG